MKRPFETVTVEERRIGAIQMLAGLHRLTGTDVGYHLVGFKRPNLRFHSTRLAIGKRSSDEYASQDCFEVLKGLGRIVGVE